MRHVVVVKEIATERYDVLFRAAVLQAYFVVGRGIVHQSVETAESFDRFLNRRIAALGGREFGNDYFAGRDFSVQVSGGIGVSVNYDWNRALGGGGANDCGANAFAPAGD